jgi:hypothetical protein
MKPTNSPWGKVQDISVFGSSDSESFFVSTASHGGVMMPRPIANLLNISAYGESFFHQKKHWICFEEDCQIGVVALQLYHHSKLELTDEKITNALISVARWSPDFLKSGILDNMRIKQIAEENKDDLDRISETVKNEATAEKMRNEHNPDLIRSATRLNKLSELETHLKSLPKVNNLDEQGRAADIYVAMEKELDFFQGNPEGVFQKGPVILVHTADNRRHLVRNYDSTRPLNLLSLCEKICSFIFD